MIPSEICYRLTQMTILGGIGGYRTFVQLSVAVTIEHFNIAVNLGEHCSECGSFNRTC